MAEEMLVLYGAPTLAKLKTGNLFSCPADEVETKWFCQMNRMLVPKGLRLIPVRGINSRVLLYIYRPLELKRDLTDARARRILQGKGYPVDDVERCVAELVRRVKSEGDFPHEIGLFLGYPPEDVEGFILWGAANAKLVGDWKVYGNVEQARETFQRYRRCTKAYCEFYRIHNSLDRLIVAAS